MAKVYNRARMTTATTGTGTVTLGSAVSGYQSFSAAGAVNADVVNYVIEDGTAWEIGTGTYTSAGTTLSRTLVQSSTGSLLSLSGSAEVFIDAPAAAFAGRLLRAPQILTSGTSYTTPNDCTGIYVEAVGGGNSGGSGNTTTNRSSGGGGGAGSYCAKFFTVVASTAYTYAVGAAGGGNSTFTVGATTITAGGGGVGGNGSSSAPGSGGAGGTATNGDVNITGGDGGTGAIVSGTTLNLPQGGIGGSSFFGGPGAYGSGGRGGGHSNSPTAGIQGAIRIWEFA